MRNNRKQETRNAKFRDKQRERDAQPYSRKQKRRLAREDKIEAKAAKRKPIASSIPYAGGKVEAVKVGGWAEKITIEEIIRALGLDNKTTKNQRRENDMSKSAWTTAYADYFPSTFDPNRKVDPNEPIRDEDRLGGRNGEAEYLRRELLQARDDLREMQAFAERIAKTANRLGTVIATDPNMPGHGLVQYAGDKIHCTLPDGAKPGDTVRMTSSGQPFDVIEMPPTEYDFSATEHVTWDDIGGLEDAKLALREAIEFPITHADLYGHYGAKPSRGVLLSGPPGCGKTMLGKAAATAVAEAQGKGAKAKGGGFIYIKGPEVLSKYIGEAEQTVRSLFKRARAHKTKTGQACVIFIDEAEALLSSRTRNEERSISSTLVPAFLAEMDGLQDSGAFVILSTNHADALDSAITRDGRIDRKIAVQRPDAEQLQTILELSLRKTPTKAKNLAATICAEIQKDKHVVQEAQLAAGDQPVSVQLRLRECMSGAMAAGIVRRATELAMRRDREAGTKTGVTVADAKQAVSNAALEARGLDWSADLMRCAGRAVVDASIHTAAQTYSTVVN